MPEKLQIDFEWRDFTNTTSARPANKWYRFDVPMKNIKKIEILDHKPHEDPEDRDESTFLIHLRRPVNLLMEPGPKGTQKMRCVSFLDMTRQCDGSVESQILN